MPTKIEPNPKKAKQAMHGWTPSQTFLTRPTKD